jgi:diguanylate cyclase (GGDEF)-like protein/PAS domain S-box-containing protein
MNSRQLSKILMSVGVMLSAVALLAPRAIADSIVLIWSVGCSLAIVRSAFAYRGAARSVYGLLGTAGLVLVVGIVVRTLHGEAIGVDQPLPSPADFFHVPGYLMFFLATLVIHRSRARYHDLDAWLDSLSMSLAAGLVLWGLFLGDFILEPEDSLLEIFLHAGYNVIIFFTLAVLLRVGATPGTRPIAYYILGAASASSVVADLYATYATTAASTPFVTIALSPLIYGLVAAAAVHPTAADVVVPTDRAEVRSEGGRVTFVIASLLAPVVIIIASTNAGDRTRFIALMGTIALAIMVAARVYRLLRSQREAAEKERQLSSELSSLAKLASIDDILTHLPDAGTRLAPNGHSAYLVKRADAEKSGMESFQLSESIDSEGSFLCVTPALYTELDKRILKTLVRDAGYLATSFEASALVATQRSEAEANRRIAINERRFRALVQNASDIVTVIGKDGQVNYISEAVTNVLGYQAEAFIGRSLEWVVHENDWAWAQDYLGAVLTGTSNNRQRELRAIHADGSVRLFECVMTDMRRVEGIDGVVLNATDATAKRSLERDLRDAETTDPLTLQLNRTAFVAETETAIRRSSVSGAFVGVAIINVDDFRSINEGLGPSLADQVLVEIAQAIRRSVRLNDVVARLNGDEFGILMTEGYSSLEAMHAVERVIAEIAEPIEVGGQNLTLRSTAGLVLDTDGSNTGVSLLRDADTALDLAKQQHRGETIVFEESMGEAASERIELRNTLETAILEDQLRLVYQPIVSIETGEIVSMEALSRWEHPTRGNIGPGVFIPIAESAGLINDLGEWALRTACNQVVEWAASGMDGFTVSVNMSGHQLREENIITRVRHILEETGVDPSRITIEITESVLIDDTDFIAHRISALRDLGLRLAIDDFGTGYSSLSYLTRYEFDVLKIDRSFVIPLANPDLTREREIVKAMISLASSLGAVTVAEGIEKSAEFEVLQDLRCDYAQGYLFWRPLELDQVAEAHSRSQHIAA